jgi:hypothetical protein
MKAIQKVIHICNSHQPTLKPKIAKEYVFANIINRTKKVRKHNNASKIIAARQYNQGL